MEHKSIEPLQIELRSWQAVHGLPQLCAEDALHLPELSDTQREWLTDFVRRWDAAQNCDCARCEEAKPYTDADGLTVADLLARVSFAERICLGGNLSAIHVTLANGFGYELCAHSVEGDMCPEAPADTDSAFVVYEYPLGMASEWSDEWNVYPETVAGFLNMLRDRNLI